MFLHLMGKRWRLEFGKYGRKRVWGNCDPPDMRDKTIRIDERAEGEQRLDVIIHEMLHACDWSRDEDHVKQQARDMARALWRLGYRGPK